MSSAQKILGAYWDGKLPVDVHHLTKVMGIRVEKNPFLGCSGQIELTTNGPVITVKDTEIGTRQRFTIAHEIGHFALGHLNQGHPLFRDEASNFKTGVFLPVERLANQFAAELLMPERVVSYAITNKGYKTLESLAALFGVSEVAMSWRLKNLGITGG